MATERVGIHSFAELEAAIGNAKTASAVKIAYESNANTNEFSDSEKTKLSGVESGAEANPTDAEIKTAYENNANTNAFTDAEQTKLAGITAGAEVNAVDSVFGRTGAVTAQSGDYTKSDVGLGNVDNTTDLNKPISTATQSALDAKQGDITLTTTGTSGAATLVGDTLNIPNYASGGGGGTVTEVTANAPLSVTSGTTTPDLTLAQATALANGFLSSTDWSTFNTGAGLAATANQDSTATILAGNLTGTVNSVAVATVTSGAALGATANQDSNATILSGDLTGTVNSVAVATVTSGAALGAAALPLAGGLMSGAITGNQDITGKRPIVTDTTTTINLTLGTHEGSFIYSDNGLPVTVNIIANATQAFPVGTEIDLIQAGAGAVTITPALGVNLNGANTTIPITAQWGGATLKQITVDNWIIVGKI
jgi:hypothetical protein